MSLNTSGAMEGDGSAAWFHISRGLNNRGYVPGCPKTDADHLPLSIVSQAECCARWKKDANGFRYASEESMESPRMQDRIESLYEETHFRPTNRTKSIGLSFARGILAEKKGYAVNWARYAAIQFARYKKRNLKIHSFGPEHRHMRNRGRDHEYRFDPEKGCVVHDLVGAEDDWRLNRAFTSHDPAPNGTMYDMREIVVPSPSEDIKRPLYRGLRRNNASERLSVTGASGGAVEHGNYSASSDKVAPAEGAARANGAEN